MNPTILELEVTGRFRYLWLKYVTGVNLNVHCGRSLLGKYSELVSADLTMYDRFDLDEHEAKYFYLCGVATPPKWGNNFHLAFRYAEGKTLDVERLGVRVLIANAEEIPIQWVSPSNNPSTPEWVRELARNRGPAYFTCRNWQFACQIAEEVGYGR